MTDETTADVVVVGAGQAAGTAVASLRQFGFDGSILLIGEEPFPPYQRPPLSKGYFKGETALDSLYVKPEAFYPAESIAIRLDRRVLALDRAARRLTLSDGTAVRYGTLILATGARPRTLPVPGADLAGVLTLRTLSDVERLKPLALPGRRLVVIGAGYIGLEAAAVARQTGLDVVVLEAAERVLSRVTGPVVSAFYEDLHRKAGVEVRTNARFSRFVGADGRLQAVEMADGETMSADLALIGIGIQPNQEIAAAAGIVCSNGIDTDGESRTSDPAVFAIGDCANRPIVQYGVRGRLESVHNAVETGKIAAAAIAGRPPQSLEAPWFWSDQYDVKLQTAGLFTGSDRAVLRGDPAARRFSVWYLKDGALLAVDAVNVGGDFMLARRLVGRGIAIDPEFLADPASDLKSLMSKGGR